MARPVLQIVVIKQHHRLWAAVSIIMISVSLFLCTLSIINFPLNLVAKAARASLIINNDPSTLGDFAKPPASYVEFYAWNYTTVLPTSIDIQQIRYLLTLQTVRYNVSFVDHDTVVRYWSRNEWHVMNESNSAFYDDVIIQPSFVHFYSVAAMRPFNIPKVLQQMVNRSSGAPSMSDITTSCDVDPVYYSDFISYFSQSNNILNFMQEIDRDDASLAKKLTGIGINRDNVKSVAVFLHRLSLIGYLQDHRSSSEMTKTSPARIFSMFMPNQSTDASAYKPDEFYEKYTGIDDILKLKRYRKYKGQSTVTSPSWLSDEVVDGARDYQADSFPDEVSLQLKMFSPTTMRVETWRNLGTADLFGLELVHFEQIAETFQSASSCGPNSKYYMNGPTGIFNMNPSAAGAPVHLSQPHFLGGDASLSNNFNGLFPNHDSHASFLDIEPNLGLPLRAKNRFQTNIRIEKGMSSSDLVHGNHAYLPIWWIEFGGEADAATTANIKSKLVAVVQACFAVLLLISMLSLPLFCYGIGVLKASVFKSLK
jgi:hypothetical protein